MKALFVLDMQVGMLEHKDFSEERKKIISLIKHFKDRNEKVIFTRHVDNDPNSIIANDTEKGEIDKNIAHFADYTIDKQTASPFINTKLEEVLIANKIDHVYITGFNTEYCCLFTAISAFDRGYKVTFIEDATATVNDEDTYEMKGIDINDFVGCVLDWSGLVEVLYFDEFMENYAESK